MAHHNKQEPMASKQSCTSRNAVFYPRAKWLRRWQQKLIVDDHKLYHVAQPALRAVLPKT